MFYQAFNSAMKWLGSDQGSRVLGTVAETAGGYLVSRELQKQQNEYDLQQMQQEQEQRLQFNNHVQNQRDERSRWADSADLAPANYAMRGAMQPESLAGNGLASSGILPKMRR